MKSTDPSVAAASGVPEQGFRQVPADGQCGDPLAGPARFAAPPRPQSHLVQTLGVKPNGFLRRGILWEVFGVENVVVAAPAELAPPASLGEALVVDRLEVPLRWSSFSSVAGNRCGVIDVGAFAAMLVEDGFGVAVAAVDCAPGTPQRVFRSRVPSLVYGDAPRVRVVAPPLPVSGFGLGDVFHLYAPVAQQQLRLRTLVDSVDLQRFAGQHQVCIWGRADDSTVALLTVRTAAGGEFVVMDLHAVDRVPEASGAESPATHILLAALAVSTVQFGKFICAYASYEQYVENVAALVQRHARFAKLERCGTSTGGRAMWLLKLTLGAADLPIVLNTCTVHPLEWVPAYGLLRYVNFLLTQCAADTEYARELLRDRQFWWVLSSCPDGWESRDQQDSGINLDRNFPGSWQRCVPEQVVWDTYNRRFNAPGGALETAIERGPAPGTQPEVQALMRLLDSAPLSTVVDFHETTAFKSFLHQSEGSAGEIRDLQYHCELVERVALGFNGRLYANGTVLATRPGLNDVSTWNFRSVRSLERLVPCGCSGWIHYASERGVKALVVEAAGSDCTHYQSIRRSEYSAHVAEQVLASELGGLLRNVWGAPWQVQLRRARVDKPLRLRVFDRNDVELEARDLAAGSPVALTIPPGGWVRWRQLER